MLLCFTFNWSLLGFTMLFLEMYIFPICVKVVPILALDCLFTLARTNLHLSRCIGHSVCTHKQLICHKTTYKNLSSRRIHWCGANSFGGVILKKVDEKCPNKYFAPYSWVRLVENSNTEFSGASGVLQSRGKYFLWSPAAVFLLGNWSWSISIDVNRETKYNQTLVYTDKFWKSLYSKAQTRFYGNITCNY